MIGWIKSLVVDTARGVRDFIAAKWGEYTPHGQFMFVLAIAALTVDAAISYQYGVSMTTLHGIGFALVAIAFAVLPDQASIEWQKGKKNAAFWIGAACVPLGVVAYQSHIGYGSGVRSGDVQQTAVQNARYDGGQMLVTKTEERIGELRTEFASLNSEMDKLVATKVNGWSVDTRPASPKALDGMISAKELEQEREGRTGKGPRYQDRTNELAHLQNLRALAVKIERNQAAYDAAQAELVALTKEAGSIQYTSSTVVNQNGAFAKLWKVANGAAPAEAIKADAVTSEFINIITAGSGALAFMMLAPLLMFAAGRNRRVVPAAEHEAILPDHDVSNHSNAGPANAIIDELRRQLAAAQGAVKDVRLNVSHSGVRPDYEKLLQARGLA